ncbi:hypothetical protein ElyMa_001952300 [Elysia marginata]|uniref:Uncharacterized protein n=1 Tax=Elysia marginata TaxID=1093978 RepID=A0AAV4EY74_9GAST|nr:hypothetical protein ElyMa_001952300 [Elysia marginata]
MKECHPWLTVHLLRLSRGVIHQLCRVLVLLHKKDPVRNLPSDALSLVQWGHQMVEDFRQQEGTSSDMGAVDFPTSQISMVDVDMEYPHPLSPVYATPDGSTDQGFPLPALGQATPYSSVPVPLTPGHVDEPAVRKSGFATISRTPSIPNGVIVKNLEFSQPREETLTPVNLEASYQEPAPSVANHHQPHVDTEPVVRLRREEFRNLLITNNKDLPSQQHQPQQRISSVDDLEGETVITGGEGESLDRESLDRQNNKLGSCNENEEAEEEEAKFNTFGRKNKLDRSHVEKADRPVLRSHKSRSLPRPLSTPNFGLSLEQYFHSDRSQSPADEKPAKRPMSHTYSIPHKHPRQQALKKNIITNPNAVKGSNSSFAAVLGAAVGKKSKQLTAAPANTRGYFANGHFYDPNPMPVVDSVDGEVYAPGSNYSDHSNIMSTFLGDAPRSRSPSSSNQSEEGEDSENSGGELDVFPFDPNDATDPVEV